MPGDDDEEDEDDEEQQNKNGDEEEEEDEEASDDNDEDEDDEEDEDDAGDVSMSGAGTATNGTPGKKLTARQQEKAAEKQIKAAQRSAKKVCVFCRQNLVAVLSQLSPSLLLPLLLVVYCSAG